MKTIKNLDFYSFMSKSGLFSWVKLELKRFLNKFFIVVSSILNKRLFISSEIDMTTNRNIIMHLNFFLINRTHMLSLIDSLEFVFL
jgi:hypothetical protein